MADKRKMGCMNEVCEFHITKKMHKADFAFCPKCGQELKVVCKKCFAPIEDAAEGQLLCAPCQAEADEKKAQMKETAALVGEKAKLFGTVVAVPFCAMLLKKSQEILTNASSSAIKGVITDVIDKKKNS